MSLTFSPCGDGALSVVFENQISEAVNHQVLNLQRKIIQKNLPGIRDMIPSYCALLVQYDSWKYSYEELTRIINSLDSDSDLEEAEARTIYEIPVCYATRFGMDMPEAEKITGLDRDEIIKIHSKPLYRIYMLGFLPGFPYLGGLDERIHMARLANPRVKIPAGSVGIGGSQTGVYPVNSPGGWRLLGATPVDLYDPLREKPILYQAGDYIKFNPISLDEYYDIRQQIQKGTYEIVEKKEHI